MRRAISAGLVLTAFLVAWAWGTSVAVFAAELKFFSEQTVTGFKFPESVACDQQGKALYASQFGSELKPLQKHGKGKISKLSLNAKSDPKVTAISVKGVNPNGIYPARDGSLLMVGFKSDKEPRGIHALRAG